MTKSLANDGDCFHVDKGENIFESIFENIYECLVNTREQLYSDVRATGDKWEQKSLQHAAREMISAIKKRSPPAEDISASCTTIAENYCR